MLPLLFQLYFSRHEAWHTSSVRNRCKNGVDTSGEVGRNAAAQCYPQFFHVGELANDGSDLLLCVCVEGNGPQLQKVAFFIYREGINILTPLCFLHAFGGANIQAIPAVRGAEVKTVLTHCLCVQDVIVSEH